MGWGRINIAIFGAECKIIIKKRTSKAQHSFVGQHCRRTNVHGPMPARRIAVESRYERGWNTIVWESNNEICTKWILICSIWMWSAHIFSMAVAAAGTGVALKVMAENMFVSTVFAVDFFFIFYHCYGEMRMKNVEYFEISVWKCVCGCCRWYLS